MPPSDFPKDVRKALVETIPVDLEEMLMSIESLKNVFSGQGSSSIFTEEVRRGFQNFFKGHANNQADGGGGGVAEMSTGGSAKIDWTSVITPLTTISKINLSPDNIINKLNELYLRSTGMTNASVIGSLDFFESLIKSMKKFKTVSETLMAQDFSKSLFDMAYLTKTFDDFEKVSIKTTGVADLFTANFTKAQAKVNIEVMTKHGKAMGEAVGQFFSSLFAEVNSSLKGLDAEKAKAFVTISDSINIIPIILDLNFRKLKRVTKKFLAIGPDLGVAIGSFFRTIADSVGDSLPKLDGLKKALNTIKLIPMAIVMNYIPAKMGKSTGQGIADFLTGVGEGIRNMKVGLVQIGEMALMIPIIAGLGLAILVASPAALLGAAAGAGIAVFLTELGVGIEALGGVIATGVGALGALAVLLLIGALATGIYALAISLKIMDTVNLPKVAGGLALLGLAFIPLAVGTLLLSVAFVALIPAFGVFVLLLPLLAGGLWLVSKAIGGFTQYIKPLMEVLVHFIDAVSQTFKDVLSTLSNVITVISSTIIQAITLGKEILADIVNDITNLSNIDAAKIDGVANAIKNLGLSLAAFAAGGAAGGIMDAAGNAAGKVGNFLTFNMFKSDGKPNIFTQLTQFAKLSDPLQGIASALGTVASSLERIQNVDISRTTKQLKELSDQNMQVNIGHQNAGAAMPSIVATNVNNSNGGGGGGGGGYQIMGNLPQRYDPEINLNMVVNSLMARNL